MCVESTENTHSTFPTASSLTCTWSKILSQVPSAVHNRNRSWGLLQDRLTLHLRDEVLLEGCRCAQEVPT